MIKKAPSQPPGLQQCSIDGEKDHVSVTHPIRIRRKEGQRDGAKKRRRHDNKGLFGLQETDERMIPVVKYQMKNRVYALVAANKPANDASTST